MKKNKLLKIFIVTVLLVSIELSAIAASSGVVNVETVRVREKATTNSDIVELVSIGDKVTITGEEGDWYKVKVGKVIGYIRKDLLTVEGKTVEVSTNADNNNDANEEQPDEPEQTEEPDIAGETAGQETPSNEEMPTENPTEEEPSIAQEVEENDKTISTLKLAGGVSAGKKVQLTKETKIKILPLVNSSNIAKLEANTEVTVLEVINNWCRIETGEYAGWVRIDQ